MLRASLQPPVESLPERARRDISTPMLTISLEQATIMARESGRSAFVGYAIEAVESACPGLYSRDHIRATARLALERGRGYGLERYPEFMRYLDLLLTLGSDFDQHSPYRELLTDERHPPRIRTLMAMDHAKREYEALTLAAEPPVVEPPRDEEPPPETAVAPEPWVPPPTTDAWRATPDDSELEPIVIDHFPWNPPRPPLG